jgi:hypothetical protein
MATRVEQLYEIDHLLFLSFHIPQMNLQSWNDKPPKIKEEKTTEKN